jgi:hypothetical protein
MQGRIELGNPVGKWLVNPANCVGNCLFLPQPLFKQNVEVHLL